MHQFPDGWDLISLWHQFGRNDKFFALYLALMGGFSFFRSLRLARSLWSYSFRSRIRSHDKESDPSDLLAASALANKLSLTNDLLSRSDVLSTVSETREKRLVIVEAAESRFQYLWAKTGAQVAGIKNLAVLTIILSALTVSYNIMKLIAVWPIPKCGDCSGGPAELFIPFIVGLTVSAVFFALSTLFASALARRRAEWTLFVARANSQKKVE